ncbi:MAG TPA: hypothetical protein VF589_12625 [Allosphingosinicella sp.]|jgi:hypothetical protein
MFDQDRISFDPRTGRPQPPVAWKVIGLEVVFGWLTAAIFLSSGVFVARQGAWGWCAACLLMAALILLSVQWRKKQVDRAKAAFEKQLAAYERGLDAMLRQDRP